MSRHYKHYLDHPHNFLNFPDDYQYHYQTQFEEKVVADPRLEWVLWNLKAKGSDHKDIHF